jgi:tRNA U34 5-carboxymethylaminomethyl modifying GTPase MnmE/TrmE
LVARLVLDKRVIDQVILLFMKAPFSSTGEDVCEIHCHGSRAVIDVLLARLGVEDRLCNGAAGRIYPPQLYEWENRICQALKGLPI